MNGKRNNETHHFGRKERGREICKRNDFTAKQQGKARAVLMYNFGKTLELK